MCKIFKTSIVLLVCMAGFYYYKSHNNLTTQAPPRTDIKIVLYSLDGCGYCVLAEELLQDKNIPYDMVKLNGQKDLAMKLFNQTGQRTVPYVFVNDEFIGGYQELKQLDNENKL